MKCSLLLLVCLFSVATGFSQAEYVITTTQDTIYGKITILMASSYGEEIAVKSSSGKKEMSSSQFISFVKDGATYQVIPCNGKDRIMKLVKPGKYVSLYIFRGDSQYEFGTEFLYKGPNVGKEMPSMGYKKTLTKFLNDCPGIATADENLFKRSNLSQLVDYYNNCMLGRNEATATPTQEKDSILELLTSIKAKVAAQNNNNTELLTLINDISQKIINKEKVPSYLTEALKAQTVGIASVKEDVEKLLKKLE